MGRGRTEAFSDGVFTIAATLLVLGIRVPQVADGQLLRALLDRWPDYFAYGVSFIVIGNMWVNHHSLFRHLVRIDRPFLYANLMLLMFVALLPFPTAVFAASFGQEQNLHIAAAAYSIEMLCISLSFTAIWLTAFSRKLMTETMAAPKSLKAGVRMSLGTIVWVVSIPLSQWNVFVCMGIWMATLAYYFFEHIDAPEPTAHAT